MAVGVYIHIPFCKSKCIYCDFLSFSGREQCTERYADVLIKEIERKSKAQRAVSGKMPEVDTVFIGGGTPTLLKTGTLLKIISSLEANFNILPGAEFTVEANPGTVTLEKLKALKRAGVNRLSMGVQSFDDYVLGFLGRIHSAGQAVEAFKNARIAGFDNINLDIIFGMPFDDRNAFKSTLSKALELNPEHISAYSLIVEENTVLFDKISSGELPFPEDIVDRDDYSFCKTMFLEKGYGQYEISNFALSGKECRHNLKYWRQDEYLGFGLGAASFMNGKRFSNTDDFDGYLASGGSPDLKESIELSFDELAAEFIMLGFRTVSGPMFVDFEERYGKNPWIYYEEKLEKLKNKELIEVTGVDKCGIPTGCRLTEKGLDFANEVFCEFV